MTTRILDRDWLLARVTEIIGDDDPIAPDEDLTLYGLDSMGLMRLIMSLDDLGIELGFEDMAQRPTIDGWWDLIRQRMGDR